MLKIRSWFSSIKKADLAIISIILGIALFSGIIVYGGSQKRLQVVIQGQEGSWIYDLQETRREEVLGPLGVTIVEIAGGQVKITESPCPNQTCIAAPALSHNGEWNACLPNKVIIRIEGESSSDGIDIIVQ
ncbi:MAG TPA: NusG domain II-containing protein [Treponemataceae bacterium]|nr:NusG domain II-containing protein [Treponemataceae bacterium]